MTNFILAIVILLAGVFLLYQLKILPVKQQQRVYQWWHIPWEALLFSVIMFLVYHYCDIPDFFFFNLFSEGFQVEAVYSLVCIVLWMVLRSVLRSPSVHNSLIGLYRRLFAKKQDDEANALPFPFFLSDGVVKARVGQVFYRWVLKFLVLMVVLVYTVFFLLVHFAEIDFYLISAFGILGMLPIIEYYIYLGAEVPTEEQEVIVKERQDSCFDELWNIYVGTFDNYSVAWKRKSDEEEMKRTKQRGIDNDDTITAVMKRFSEDQYSAIIENCDLVTAFIKLEPFIDLVEKNGRHVLVALEIPQHFTEHQEKSYTDEISDKLSEILKRRFNVYDEKSTKEVLRENVIIAPLSLIVRQGLDYEWMSKIGLIVFVNIFDKGISNLYENRKFCYILNAVNEKYQLLFITPHRRGVEASMKNTWLTGALMEEVALWQYSRGDAQYFIGYNYEEYEERFRKILVAWPTEPMYSGSEMSPIALSFKNGLAKKVVTPVHYLELAYTNAVEGPEEFEKFHRLLNTDLFEVTRADINENIKSHLLPVDQIVEKQVFSVVFDQDNNAPAVYSKWRHLGYAENFSIVISKPYLFRDYFNSNHDHFVTAPFAALEPHLCKSRITLAIILLNMLKDSEQGIEEKDIRKLLKGYYADVRSVPTLIKELFYEYFSSDLANELRTGDMVVFDGKEYYHQTRYWLELTDAIDLSFLGTVQIKDESNNVLFSVLKDLMFQNFCKGQIHSFNGKPYVIADYDNRLRTLNVRSKNGNDQEVIFYKPCFKVVLSGEPSPIEDMLKTTDVWSHHISGQPLSIIREGFETQVEVETTDMYTFTSYKIGSHHSKDYCPPTRIYKKGKVLRYSICFLPKEEYIKDFDKIRKGLQILLYEAMQSVFPHHAQYLIISSEGSIDKDLPWVFNQFEDYTRVERLNQEKQPTLTYYFIEDANVDLGLIGALSNVQNVWYLFGYIYDYLIWLTEGDAVIPAKYEDYRIRKGFDRLSFLKYGRESLPSYFDVDLLINFIRDFFGQNESLRSFVVERITPDVTGTCDFCGEKFKNGDMQRLDDGRMRCAECSEGAVDTDRQFKELVEKVRNAFLTHLGINFSGIVYTAKLVSAVELHKLGGYEFSITNGYDVREIIGLACDRKLDEFYVENGYKPAKTFGIIAHEMTHIWEYNNDNFKKVRKTNEDLVEGLAVWTDLFLSEKNGSTNIEAKRKSWLSRDDKYGRGLRFIMENCPDDPYGYIREKAKTL